MAIQASRSYRIYFVAGHSRFLDPELQAMSWDEYW
jgi:hypothetical protein